MKSKLYSYILVSLQFLFITVLILQNDSYTPSILPTFIFFIGCCFGIYTILHNPPNNFNISPEIKENATLITTGAYRYIRHPMYFSVLLIMLGVVLSNLTFLNFIIYGCLIITLFLKVQKEEILWMQRSSEYRNYMLKTKKMIPFIL